MEVYTQKRLLPEQPEEFAKRLTEWYDDGKQNRKIGTVEKFREMDRKLREVYGDCEGLLEKAVSMLCNHEGVDVGNPIKARLLTDEDVDKWEEYKSIGTVEECREAMKKTNPMKPEALDNDFDYYKCPVCGEYIWATDNINDHKHCLNCGQAIDWEESEEE